MKAPFLARLALASALVAALGVPLAVLAQSGAPDPAWASLSPQQRAALAPLQNDWHELGPQRRAKWLEIAGRYPGMAPKQQQRMQQRMTEWSRMSPEQRVEARTNFQRSKDLPQRDRQAEWDAYRSLPKDERDALAARARPAPGEVGQVLRRPTPLEARTPKSNIVGEPLYRERSPRPLPPSRIQGNPGATTNLVTTPPAPPPHQQQPGLPKITAGPGMVDKATLLPQRGPQGAGVRGSPASGAKK